MSSKRKKIQSPTEKEMREMIAHIDQAKDAQKKTEAQGFQGRAFTVYENTLEGYVRSLVKEVRRLRGRANRERRAYAKEHRAQTLREAQYHRRLQEDMRGL